MSFCCLITILVVVIVAIVILAALQKIYQLFKTLHKDKKNADEAAAIKTIYTADYTSIPKQPPDDTTSVDDANKEQDNHDDNEEEEDETVGDILVAELHNGCPSIFVCREPKLCVFTEFCNVQLCRHVMDVARMDNDKNTVRNVTYIHLPACIVVFVTHNATKNDQDSNSEEDINYIISYTSKHVDISVYTIFYDGHKFIDYRDRLYDRYEIDLSQDGPPPVRHIPATNLFPRPSAPQPPHLSTGNFFYIAKK